MVTLGSPRRLRGHTSNPQTGYSCAKICPMETSIVITGHNRVGKTTLALLLLDNLVRQKGLNVFYLPFGSGLRQELIDSGFTKSYLDSKTPAARRLLRAFGDARREAEGSDYYANVWLREAREAKSNFGSRDVIYIADDVYHLIEAKAMLTMPGLQKAYFVGVNRPGFDPNEEAMLYDSVKETRLLMGCFSKANLKTRSKIHKVVGSSGNIPPLKTLFVENVYNNTEEYIDYLEEYVLPKFLNNF